MIISAKLKFVLSWFFIDLIFALQNAKDIKEKVDGEKFMFYFTTINILSSKKGQGYCDPH